MTEATVPVRPHRTCAESDDDVVPFCGVITCGGAQSGGDEIPVERSGFLKNISPEPIFYH